MPQYPAPSPQPRIILASNSPRRRELLREAGYDFIVMPPEEDVECGVCSTSGPAGLVAELAYRKAAAVWERLRDNPEVTVPTSASIILGADTIAECDGFILGKPRDEEDARAMLTKLSGRDHRVLTGVCLMAVPIKEGPSELPLPPGEGRGEGALAKKQKRMPAYIREFARELRKSQTDAEQLLWSLLRDHRIAGCKFRRQHPVPPYILDFYCHEHGLAIELDSGQHNTEQGRQYDSVRSSYIQNRGIRELRFWNHDVLQDTDTVLETIWNALHVCEGSLTPNPSPKGRGGPAAISLFDDTRTSHAILLRVAVTKLRMDALTNQQLTEYLESGQWEGKAGAFGYQDGIDWVHVIEGSESNVVGLPLELLAEMLRKMAASGEVRAASRNRQSDV